MLEGPIVDWLTRDESRRNKVKFLLCEWRLKRLPEARIIVGPTQSVSDAICINVDEFLAQFPSSADQFFDRALLNMSRMVTHPAMRVVFSGNIAPLFCDDQDAGTMLEQLEGMGYIAIGDRGPGPRITPKGWQRIKQLGAPGRTSRQVFVAMWFDPSRNSFYQDGIRPAVEADGITQALRIDGKEHNSKIDDEIIAEIRRSRYVVADFTGDRGGVYFEAGFALGLGLPVIWCVDENDVGRLHFDTRQYNHIIYTSSEDLRVKLNNRIRATMPRELDAPNYTM